LLQADLLDHSISSAHDALPNFGDRVAAFEGRFRAAIASVAARVPRTVPLHDLRPSVVPR
jgi:hypothetical protein